mmetsp:Transcript_13735/g.43434  ORF Transcript_13735/g.43434 Transcript_13735/m.43434 type:complete len:205 (+) Transcript_13735:1003-1617(+)
MHRGTMLPSCPAAHCDGVAVEPLGVKHQHQLESEGLEQGSVFERGAGVHIGGKEGFYPRPENLLSSRPATRRAPHSVSELVHNAMFDAGRRVLDAGRLAPVLGGPRPGLEHGRRAFVESTRALEHACRHVDGFVLRSDRCSLLPLQVHLLKYRAQPLTLPHLRPQRIRAAVVHDQPGFVDDELPELLERRPRAHVVDGGNGLGE